MRLIGLGLLAGASPLAKAEDGAFAALDRNADGAVSFTEFAVAKKRWFEELDADGDRRLTPEEHGLAPAPDPLDVFALPEFRLLDQDGDLLVTLRELGGAVRAGFDPLDAMQDGRKDGSITREEYERGKDRRATDVKAAQERK